ncbi:MAG TPA: hypothetical protein VL346_08195, partial [Acidobacteriaceae bacterium]|nr:hypothetical protein [Acidobacteriaceae bacterium]
LVVDAANAEPVGLFFAGGTDTAGVEQAIASPAREVLAALDAQVPGASGTAASYSFVGGADHPVSCLNYGASNLIARMAQQGTLAPAEQERAEAALVAAQPLLTTPGVARIGVTASSDTPKAGAIAVYLEPGVTVAGAPPIPASIGGMPTVVVPAESTEILPSQPRAASFSQALTVKRRVAASLLKANPAIFGIGVGQSLDNPVDAALVLFADRNRSMASLPTSIDGQRVRLILMDRFHVTRAHATPANGQSSCALRRELEAEEPSGFSLSLKDSLLPRE